MKKSDIAIDYRSLVLSTIKKKYLSLLMGFTTVTIILIIGFWFAAPYMKFVSPTNQDVKKEKVKGTTTKEIETQTYVVKEGDQLYLIAEKFYGSGLNMADIMRTNNITDPNLIEVGQKLIIPRVSPGLPTTGDITGTAAKTEKVTLKGDEYIVAEEDTLAKIALQAYGDSYAWKKIADANNIADPDNLEVGKTLIIPR